MKYLLYSLFLSLFYLPVSAQIIVDAGNDTIVMCTSDTSITKLGGMPSVSNGVPPYIYEWSIKEPYIAFPGSPLSFHASDFLNDTTLSNPIITDGLICKKMMFHLKVTDSIGNIGMDSCLVMFSVYITNLWFWDYAIWQGDSIYLNKGSNVGGGIGSLTYLWKPNIGLSDSTSLSFWVKPDTTIAYYVTVTDSVGCVLEAPPLYYINVLHVGMDESEIIDLVKVYPNPVKSYLFIDKIDNLEIYRLTLTDVNGKVVFNYKGYIEKIYTHDFIKGMYLLELNTEKGAFIKKILIE